MINLLLSRKAEYKPIKSSKKIISQDLENVLENTKHKKKITNQINKKVSKVVAEAMKDHNKKNLVRRMISEVHKVVASQSVSPPRDQSRLVTPMTLNFRFPNLKPSPNASPLKSPEKEKQVNKVTFRRKSILPAVEIVKKTRTTFVKKKKYVKDGLSPVTDPVKQLSRFDCELTKILAQRYKSYNQPSLGSMDTKRYTPFEKAFSSLTKLSKCNLDNYLDSVSYFNKSREEVSTLYNAINEPERNKHGFGSIFNIPVNQYLTESQSQELNKENQKKVINDLYNILLDLDSSIELPKKVPSYTKLEELISPRIFEKSLKYKSLSDFKKVYEDPRNDPKFKIKTDPFKSPKNQQEQSYNNLLTQIGKRRISLL